MAEPPPKPERNPERLKIEGDWEQAVEKALKKPRPKSGWPVTKKAKQKKKGRES